jgi:gliding motility-associated-like protein
MTEQTKFKEVKSAVNYPLYIPDAFSPDQTGPDANNMFTIQGPAMRYYKIEIYNKWGEIVYKSDRMDESWDGVANGQKCSTGVYIYKISTTDHYGVARDYKGTITLLR